MIIIITPSATVSLVQDSMPLWFQCELKKTVNVSLRISSQVTRQYSREVSLSKNFFLHSWHKFHDAQEVINFRFIKRFYHLT